MRIFAAIAAATILALAGAFEPANANCGENPGNSVTTVTWNYGNGTCATRYYVWYCGHIVYVYDGAPYSC